MTVPEVAVALFARFVVKQGCIDCDRICPRCRYDVSGGWEHVPSKSISGVIDGRPLVACTLQRAVRPMVERIDSFLTHQEQHMLTVQVAM